MANSEIVRSFFRGIILAVTVLAMVVACNGPDRLAFAATEAPCATDVCLVVPDKESTSVDLTTMYKLTHSVVDREGREQFSVTSDDKGRVDLVYPFISGGCIKVNELKIQSVESGEGGLQIINLVWRSDRGAPCKAFLRVKLKAGMELPRPGRYLIQLLGTQNFAEEKIILLGRQEIFVKDQAERNSLGNVTGKTADKEQDAVKKTCLAATVNAIKLEMRRQQGQAILDRLQADLEKFQNMTAEDFNLPEKVLEEAYVEGKAIDNGILYVPMMSRSGPWYHMSGIVGGDYELMKPGVKYRVTYYKVYPRMYWHMPSSYVCVAEVR